MLTLAHIGRRKQEKWGHILLYQEHVIPLWQGLMLDRAQAKNRMDTLSLIITWNIATVTQHTLVAYKTNIELFGTRVFWTLLQCFQPLLNTEGPVQPLVTLRVCVATAWENLLCLSSAMSSYLFIVKYELPLVIQTFLGKHSNTG